jgi:hypothetical protein
MINAPISIGEALDKISILEIKSERICDATKRDNVLQELDYLTLAAQQHRAPDLEAQLKHINELLWDVEDELRFLEQRQEFGAAFIALARSVYVLNDQRAAVKKQINLAAGSELVEEKSYATPNPMWSKRTWT